MDGGAQRTTVHRVAESDTTEHAMQGFVAMFYSPNNFNSLANINYNSNTEASQKPLLFFFNDTVCSVFLCGKIPTIKVTIVTTSNCSKYLHIVM